MTHASGREAPSTPVVVHAYVIGLPDSFRGEELITQLTSIGVETTLVPGVVVADLVEPLETIYDDDAARTLMRRPMTAGEIGCALAHRSVYETMLASDDATALVFEDDARLIAPLEIADVQGLLDTSEPRVVTFYSKPGYLLQLDGLKGSTGIEYARAAVAPTTTTGYALNRSAAQALLLATTPVRHAADWPPPASASVMFFAPVEMPVRPLPDESSSLSQDRDAAVASRSARGKRLVRRMLVIAHVPWFRHRHSYGPWRAYLLHEMVRMPAFGYALKRNPGPVPRPVAVPEIVRPLLRRLRRV